jgi:hypothetical protein
LARDEEERMKKDQEAQLLVSVRKVQEAQE